MNSLPPAFNSASFNSNAFSAGKYVTRADADRLYLPMSAGAVLSYLTGITPGTAAASRALVLDSSSNINDINVLGATQINITRNGSQLSIINGANNALIEVPTSDMLRLVRGFAVNICSSGVTIEKDSTRDARSVIDLGQTTSNKHIALYNDTSSYYGISANNSALQLQSGGGFTFNTGCTNASPLGTKVFGIGSAGRLEIPNNQMIGNASYNNMIYLASTGTVLINSSVIANSSNWLEVNGQSYFSGNIGLGINAPSFPLHINTTISSSIPGSYGYLSASGAGNGSGSGSVQVSLYCSGRAFAVEFDAYSDRRLKQNIVSIDSKKALDFIDKVEPVEYEWRNENDGKRQGYIAQQLLATGLFPDICTQHVDPKMVADDESPEGYSLSLQYNNIIPILHSAIRSQRVLLKQQQASIDEMRSELKILKGRGKLKAISE